MFLSVMVPDFPTDQAPEKGAFVISGAEVTHIVWYEITVSSRVSPSGCTENVVGGVRLPHHLDNSGLVVTWA